MKMSKWIWGNLFCVLIGGSYLGLHCTFDQLLSQIGISDFALWPFNISMQKKISFVIADDTSFENSRNSVWSMHRGSQTLDPRDDTSQQVCQSFYTTWQTSLIDFIYSFFSHTGTEQNNAIIWSMLTSKLSSDIHDNIQ